MNGNFFPGATVFRLYSEKGVPPEMSVMLAYERGFTVEWPSFISQALSNGWTLDRTKVAIKTSVMEAAVFDRDELKEFDHMCDGYFNHLQALQAGGANA